MFWRRIRGLTLVLVVFMAALPVAAAPYAAFVIDMRDGAVLHARNADTRLHPASLTKMMTLYIVFAEIRAGRLDPESTVTISANAASEPPSRMGLRSGQRITVRSLIRGTLLRSANDAATALAEVVSGSEEEFARYMTAVAREMGMSQTTFRNAHGLTAAGHMSTARDMATLGRRLFFDFPEYYHMFSRRTMDTEMGPMRNTNWRLLDSYQGADGIKTGFTNAAGYNLVATAQRDGRRVLVSMFGGTDVPQRTRRVAELLDLGLANAPRYAPLVALAPVSVDRARNVASGIAVASVRAESGLVPRAARPLSRADAAVASASMADRAAEQAAIEAAIIAANVGPPQAPPIDPVENPGARFVRAPGTELAMVPPVRRPEELLIVEQGSDSEVTATASVAAPPPEPPPPAPPPERAEAALSTGNWVVHLGAFRNRQQAERQLIRTALIEVETFEFGTPAITSTRISGVDMFQARFTGLSQQGAEKACVRLFALGMECEVVAPAL